MMPWPHRALRSPVLYGVLLLISLAVVVPGDLRGHIFAEPTPEDYLWIQGEMDRLPYFTRHRYLQRYLQHDLARVIFANEPSRITQFGILLHMLNTVLLFGVFVRLFSTLRRPREGVEPAALMGALGAAWVFYFNRTLAPVYISAHSYLLVVTFALLSLYFLLRHIQHPSPFWWGGVMAAYMLGLLSNLFALGLPLIWLLVEWVAPRSMRGARPLRSLLLRYSVALAIPAGYIGALWGTYGRGFKGEWEGERGLRIIWCIPDYLAYLVTRYTSDDAVLEAVEGFPVFGFRVAVAVAIIAACVAAYQRRGNLNLWVALVLFIIAWQAMTYPLAIISPQPLNRPWRYYLPVLGLAMFAGFLLAVAAQRVLRRAAPLIWVPILMLALLAVPIQQRLAGRDGLGLLGQLLLGELPGQDQRRHCPEVAKCPAVQRLDSVAAVREVLRRGGSLRCKSLRGLDLSGLDLSGADLRSANLSATTGVGTRLNGADLRGACFNLAILRDADLSRARLDGGQINNAVISRTRFDDISGRQLSIDGTIFSSCTFNGADLTRAESVLVTYEKCRFNRTTLTGAALLNSTIADMKVTGGSLDMVRMERSVISASSFTGARLFGADFTRVRLVDVNFLRSELGSANFGLSNLVRVSFNKSGLSGADFTNARIRDIDFGGADLSRTVMTGAGPDAPCKALLCVD